MRVKLTILMCAVLVLALGASQAYGQAGGYAISKSIETVVQHGKNQMVGIIQLDYDLNGGDIDAGATITITFSSGGNGLPINVAGTATCTGGGLSCSDGSEAENDEDTGVGTITIETAGGAGDGSTINLTGARVDVSSLDAGDEILATISSTAPTGLIPISQSRRGTVSTLVAEVEAGLTVGISAASRLICNLDATEDADNDANTAETPVGGIPMITVTEGFNDAWEDDAIGTTGTMITIATLSLPDGVELRWPTTVEFTDPDDVNDTWATLTLAADDVTEAGVGETSDEENDGSMVTYAYSIQDATESMGVMDSFEIPITVVTGDIASGAGGIADIWGILGPQPADDDADVGTVLSYLKDAVTDPETVMGDFLNIGECVTYLLFPYVTCSRVEEMDGEKVLLDDWTTAMAIANTTLDDGIFGISDGATPQSGNIMLYTFPRSMMNDDGMMMMADPGAHEVASSLAAGDTWSDTCSNIVPGFNGYIIAKAGFRQGHGVAFVLGMFPGGAGIDVAHGYLGLVIPDPEFGGDRAPVAGESLGQ